jgi:hypothetical protein
VGEKQEEASRQTVVVVAAVVVVVVDESIHSIFQQQSKNGERKTIGPLELCGIILSVKR